VVIFRLFRGYLAAAYASDHLGRKKTFFLFAAGSALIAILYTQIPINDALMLFLDSRSASSFRAISADAALS